jgi:hypothetical protein
MTACQFDNARLDLKITTKFIASLGGKQHYLEIKMTFRVVFHDVDLPREKNMTSTFEKPFVEFRRRHPKMDHFNKRKRTHSHYRKCNLKIEKYISSDVIVHMRKRTKSEDTRT